MNRAEIIEYLGLTEEIIEEYDFEDVIDTAIEMVEKYDLTQYGFGLECDFENSPYVLEDLDDDDELEEVERKNGIVVYKLLTK